MGCVQSHEVTVDPAQDAAHREIERQLARDRQVQAKLITIFLCGTGESGKSTVLKQMRMRYAEPFSLEERLEYRSILLSNLTQSMTVILEAMIDFEIEFEDDKQVEWSETAMALPDIVDELDGDAVQAMKGLWACRPIQQCVSNASKFQLNDSAGYFFDNIDRFVAPNYVPTTDDIIRCRVRTTGIIESKFQVKDRVWRVIDVGGQRSERRKWQSMMEGVDILLFLVAVSEYDQTLFEDETTNRFAEAEALFTSIANSMWFARSALILFLNKIDLLEAKLPRSPLREHLPEYKGANTPAAVLPYLKDRLASQYKPHDPDRKIYTHFTCATDTKAINVVLAAVQDQIVVAALKDMLFM